MPICMSVTGGNSVLEPAGHPSTDFTPTGASVVVSTQLGLTRPSMRSGIAARRYGCLSPIDAELSMSKRRSILFTAWTALDASASGRPLSDPVPLLEGTRPPHPVATTANRTTTQLAALKDIIRKAPAQTLNS